MRSLWLGRVDYGEGLHLQAELASLVQRGLAEDTLLLLEHPPTITMGRGSNPSNLLLSPDAAAREGIALYSVDRGGDVTYHGPGQLVGYPVVDLSRHRKDVHWYLREVESALIDLLASYGIVGRRFAPHTGVWVADRKIAAIGVKVSRWVTTHGFAMNVTTRPEDFGGIVPCGIRDYGVTSLHLEQDSPLSLEAVARAVTPLFCQRFPSLPVANHVTPKLSEVSAKFFAGALDMGGGGC